MKSGESAFADKNINAMRKLHQKTMYVTQDFAVRIFRTMTIQMSNIFGRNRSVLKAENGKSRTSQRQIGTQLSQRLRRIHRLCLFHGQPRKQTLL